MEFEICANGDTYIPLVDWTSGDETFDGLPVISWAGNENEAYDFAIGLPPEVALVCKVNEDRLTAALMLIQSDNETTKPLCIFPSVTPEGLKRSVRSIYAMNGEKLNMQAVAYLLSMATNE